MTRNEAIAKIKEIKCGEGVGRYRYPEQMRGNLAKHVWNDGRFTLGFEYGYIMGLMDAFGITEKDTGEEP